MPPPSRRALLFCCAAVAAVGCSRSPVVGPGFQSGTRLAARYDELDGLRVLRSFYDRARDEECMFRVVGDHAVCLPASAAANGWYTDGTCTEEIVEIPPVADGRTPAQSLVTDPVNACDGVPTVHALGPQFPTADAWFRKSDGSCAQGSGGTRTATLRRIGAQVPIDAFVRATLAVEHGDARIGAAVYVADDGARLNGFGWDETRGEWTQVAVDSDGARRWWPVHLAFNYGPGSLGTPGTFYADTGCTQPTGIKEAHNALCPITAVVEFVAADACTQFTTRLHAAGAPVAATDLHALAADGSCVASPGDPAELFVEMGDLLAPESFAAATRVDVGDGRIVQRFDGAPDGKRILPQASDLWDRQRNVPCAVRVGADGARRCLPGGGDLDAIVYGDEACTTPIFSLSKNVACTADPVPPPEVTYNGHAYAVVGPFAATTIYAGGDGGCSAIGPPPAYDRWFQLGAEIAPSAYAPATLRTQ